MYLRYKCEWNNIIALTVWFCMRKLTLGLSVCLSGRLSQRDSRTFYAFPRETVYFIRLKLTGSLIIHFSSRARLLRSSMHTYCISQGGNYTIRFNDIFLPTYLGAHVGKLSIKGMAVQGESLRGSSVNRPQMVTRPRRIAAILPNCPWICFYRFDSFTVYYSSTASVSAVLPLFHNICKHP